MDIKKKKKIKADKTKMIHMVRGEKEDISIFDLGDLAL